MKFPYGDIQLLCDFIERKYFKVFSNRDYAHANELTVKTAFLSLLFDDSLYIMESEVEIERGYTDLTLALPAVQKRQREAEVGLARYREKLHHKFGPVLRLRSFSVVAVGFDGLVSDGR